MNTLVFGLVILANTLALFLFEALRSLAAKKTELAQSQFREKTFEQFRDDFAKRPVQAVIPRDAIDILGRAIIQDIIQYLAQSMGGPMEVPIFPRDPQPKERL
jgi:hypothetical protein